MGLEHHLIPGSETLGVLALALALALALGSGSSALASLSYLSASVCINGSLDLQATFSNLPVTFSSFALWLFALVANSAPSATSIPRQQLYQLGLLAPLRHFPGSVASPVVPLCVITPCGSVASLRIVCSIGHLALRLCGFKRIIVCQKHPLAAWHSDQGLLQRDRGLLPGQNRKMEKNPIHRDFSEITLSGVNPRLEILLNRPYNPSRCAISRNIAIASSHGQNPKYTG